MIGLWKSVEVQKGVMFRYAYEKILGRGWDGDVER